MNVRMLTLFHTLLPFSLVQIASFGDVVLKMHLKKAYPFQDKFEAKCAYLYQLACMNF